MPLAVDKQGKTIDFRLSPRRDVAAAKAFFRKALKTQGRTPESVTLEGYAASHRAIHEMAHEDLAWQGTKVRSSKYLNNMIEQDHRGVKLRLGPMLGFKDFDHAATTIAGVELGIVFARASSPWGVCAFRGKRRLRSGTRCSPLDLLATSRNRHARSFQTAPEPFRQRQVTHDHRARTESAQSSFSMARSERTADGFHIPHRPGARAAFPNLVPVHGPIHASWLNQIEIYFSIVERKV